MTLSIIGLFVTISINDTQHNSIECYCAECRVSLIVMLNVIVPNVIVPNVIMLSVIMQNVVMLGVMAPKLSNEAEHMFM
jgi:hypothetical protein